MALPVDVEKVIGVLKQELPVLRKMTLGPDTPLLSTGLLDSFAIVTLLAALDTAFGIDVDVEKIEIEELETPGSIAALCVAASKT